MIVRQFCARHCRSAISTSPRRILSCAYASEAKSSSTTTEGYSNDRSTALAESLNSSIETTKSVESSLNAYISDRLLSKGDQDHDQAQLQPPMPPIPSAVAVTSQTSPARAAKGLKKYYQTRKAITKSTRLGSIVSDIYDPKVFERDPPAPSEVTLPMLMAAQSHLGHSTSLWNPSNSGYIFGIREGIHIISLDITAAYLRRAARVVTEVARRGGLILFVGTRDRQEDIVVNAARLAGGYHIFDRWTPGSLTNGQQILGQCRVKVVDIHDRELPQYDSLLRSSRGVPALRPDLVICLNPLENEVCLHECGLYTVPTIGVIDTDANPSWVTYPIPANDDSLRCMTLVAGVLGRAGQEGQKLRMVAAAKGEREYSNQRLLIMLSELEQLSALEAG